MSGQEKTKNGRKYGNHFRKGLRGMFTRQLDICFYIVNKVVMQDIKMTKIWVKFVHKSLTRGTRGMTVIMYLVCKSKPEKSLKVLHTFNTQSFFLLITLNPIPAGVLENQDMLGGSQFDPPL